MIFSKMKGNDRTLSIIGDFEKVALARFVVYIISFRLEYQSFEHNPIEIAWHDCRVSSNCYICQL